MAVDIYPGYARPKTALRVSLWTAQALLAIAFGLAGAMKLFTPMNALVDKLPWVMSVPTWLPRFIGAAELAGALGMILPSATRIMPRLTVYAAAGLTTVMLLAGMFHFSRGEFRALPVTLLLGSLAVFVGWGRGGPAPITPKAM